MIALYPSFPNRPDEPDPTFEPEVQLAKAAGFHVAFVDLELSLGGQVILHRLPKAESDVVYRGYIIKPEDYRKLEVALAAKGRQLLEPHEAYLEAYEFPRWYAKLKAVTPRSIALPGAAFDLDAVAEQVGLVFSPHAVLVKDVVKSRKQDWYEACFIPDARDKEHVKKVVSRFLDLMDDSLAGGLVFRQFEDFKKLGVSHPKTGMPIVNEWRGFMLHGKLVYLAPYWAADYSTAAKPDPAMFEAIVKRSGLISPFFSLDVAESIDGTWMVIEINSGGASGIPEGGDGEAFYAALATGSPCG